MISKFFFFLSIISFPLFALESSQEQLFEDLLIVNYINEKMNDRFPVTFNHFLQGGYINMPSARMSCQGTFAFGYAWVPPYRVYSLLAQMTPFLEVTGNYRIFTDVEDP